MSHNLKIYLLFILIFEIGENIYKLNIKLDHTKKLYLRNKVNSIFIFLKGPKSFGPKM